MEPQTLARLQMTASDAVRSSRMYHVSTPVSDVQVGGGTKANESPAGCS